MSIIKVNYDGIEDVIDNTKKVIKYLKNQKSELQKAKDELSKISYSNGKSELDNEIYKIIAKTITDVDKLQSFKRNLESFKEFTKEQDINQAKDL